MGQKFCEMLIEHGRLREITELTTVSRFVDQLGSNVQFNEFIELHYEARKQEQLSHATTD